MKYINQKYLNYLFVTVLAVLTLALSFFLQSSSVRNSPDKLFWAAIEQSLSTAGVTRHYENETSSQKMVQTTHLNYAGDLQADTTITIYSNDGSRVVSQLLGTLSEDYIRYREISDSRLPDTVKDKWSLLPRRQEDRPELLEQTIIGTVLPTGNFSPTNRSLLINHLKENNAYVVQEFSEKNVEINGRKVDVVSVLVDVAAFQSFLKEYLLKMGLEKAANSMGVPVSADRVKIEVAIHAPSRQITKIGVENLDSPAAESFTNWGAASKEDVPVEIINFEELQAAFAGVGEQ